jgi:plastocyanin
VHHNRAAAAVAATVAVALLGACGGGGDGAAPAKAKAGAAVEMRLIAFRPASVTVKPGTAVTWTQHDAGVHTVTSGTVEQGAADVTVHPDGRFDSKELATGKTFSFTFDAPGTYTYFCNIHPATMRGDVQVR